MPRTILASGQVRPFELLIYFKRIGGYSDNEFDIRVKRTTHATSTNHSYDIPGNNFEITYKQQQNRLLPCCPVLTIPGCELGFSGGGGT